MADTTVTVARAESELVAYTGLVVSTFCWASAFIAGKIVLEEMTPLAVGAWRYALAGLVLLPFAWRQRPASSVRAVALPFAVMVVCGGLLYPWLFLLALQRTSATNTSLLIALNPVFTVLLAPLIGEVLTRRRLAGVLVALAGAATVITRGSLDALKSLEMNGGDLLAVAGAVTWAAFNLASRKTMVRLTPALTNSVIYLTGCVGLGMIGFGDDPWGQLTHASTAALGSIVAMALLSSVVAGQLFLVGVRTLGVSRTVVFVYVVPVLTAILSALLLSEGFTAPQAVGGVAVLGGVYLSTQR
jgi:drug/metabolite transporter (DMT)-like permease